MALETTSASEKLFATAQQEYKILAEYKMLQSEDIGGVYVIPSSKSSFLWFGVIFVRSGIYIDGIFRFTITLPSKFPDDTEPPTVTFQLETFHPLICPHTGVLDISDAFPNWETRENHIWQLIKYIQYVFQNPNCHLLKKTYSTSKLMNKEAADLLSQNKAEFMLKAKELVRLSRDKIYDLPPTEDKHYITFERFENDIHGPVLESIKKKTDISLSPKTSGLSWVRGDDFKPLSK